MFTIWAKNTQTLSQPHTNSLSLSPFLHFESIPQIPKFLLIRRLWAEKSISEFVLGSNKKHASVFVCVCVCISINRVEEAVSFFCYSDIFPSAVHSFALSIFHRKI